MERFSRLCHYALVAAKSCCRCCCFPSRSQPCNRWWRPPASSLPAMARRASGSYCFSPTMWCLLQLVWLYSRLSCRLNETGPPHPRGSYGSVAGICFLRSDLGGADGADDGRCPAYLLLSCALGVDGVPAIFREPGGFAGLPDSAKRQSRRDSLGFGRSGCCVLYGCAGDRANLGAAGVGHLVDLGYSAHHHSGFVADLCKF